jgi:hypothetical protein
VRYRQHVLDQHVGYVQRLLTAKDRQAKASARQQSFQQRRRQKA